MTGNDALVIARIKAGKELIRRSSSMMVVSNGEFYGVFYYNTQIAVGLKGEMPFAFNLHGWTTRTTIDHLRNLGFGLYSEKICTGKMRNEKTKRMNKVVYKVFVAGGQHKPLAEIHGLALQNRYHDWYDAEGNRIGMEKDFDIFPGERYPRSRFQI